MSHPEAKINFWPRVGLALLTLAMASACTHINDLPITNTPASAQAATSAAETQVASNATASAAETNIANLATGQAPYIQLQQLLDDQTATPWQIIRQTEVASLKTTTPTPPSPEMGMTLDRLQKAALFINFTAQTDRRTISSRNGSGGIIYKDSEFTYITTVAHVLVPGYAGGGLASYLTDPSTKLTVSFSKTSDTYSDRLLLSEKDQFQLFIDDKRDAAFFKIPSNHPSVVFFADDSAVPICEQPPSELAIFGQELHLATFGFPHDTASILPDGERKSIFGLPLFPKESTFVGEFEMPFATTNEAGSGSLVATEESQGRCILGLVTRITNNLLFIQTLLPLSNLQDAFVTVGPTPIIPTTSP